VLIALLLAAASVAPTDLSAVGVVLNAVPERSVAILRAQGQSRVVRVGETAFGGRLAAVAADVVSLDFEGERVQVRVRPGTPLRAAARAAIPSPTSAAAPEDPATPARTMLRAEVQRRIGEEQSRILAETAIAPVTGSNGQIAGFAVTRLPAGASVLADAGLRAGDVVTQINGTAIDSLPTLISLWPRLQNEKEIRAVVLRDGQPVTLSVSLK
jgi:type II secretion system protein C